MNPNARHHASRIESLESRIAPANLTASVVGHLLKIVGTADANVVTIEGAVGDQTQFSVTSSTDTINGGGSFTTPSGVTDISISLLGGNDSVTLDNAVAAIHLHGGLTINGGDGANTVNTINLTVDKNISITNGTNSTGTDSNTFTDLSVHGSVNINNGNGATSTSFLGAADGSSSIYGSISITNGTGVDNNNIKDMNVGKNVTINNGQGDALSGGGLNQIYNQYSSHPRSVIGGNVSFTNATGSISSDGIWDTEVFGNVSFNSGSGTVNVYFDGYQTSVPVLIHGNLSINTGGLGNSFSIGLNNAKTGLTVGKNLSINSGAGADQLSMNKVHVGGATNLNLGNGNNQATIDASTFDASFLVSTGSGNDTIKLATTAGSSAPTIFEGPALIKLGTGNDSLSRDGSSDANQSLYIYNKFAIKNFIGTDSWNNSKEFFPFGNSISFI